ncbi:MAG: N-acetylmuramic acid 6-phosphate etherase [Planctomycetota bacterium]|jgi:N-acetylmuramic acid 6-phosphate etherase
MMNDAGQDRGHLPTEARNQAASALDVGSVADTLAVIHDADAQVHRALAAAGPALAALVKDLVPRMERGGRLIYLGAGTSGRLGVLDASECPPTFRADPGQVVGIIAGGDGALRRSSEGREDEWDGAAEALAALALTADDTVVGIAAGGTTPYVWGALERAATMGCLTALICCVPGSALSHLPLNCCAHLIELPTGPEVVTGSTRMKAGTATKLALNRISTTAMVHLGKVWGNLMVDVRATNAKLVDRAVRLLISQTNLDRAAAHALLEGADGEVKRALVMHHRGVDAAAADALLAAHHGRLRLLLGAPR